MRPKIVVLTLIVAFAALGFIALMKGMKGAGGSEQNSTNFNAAASSESGGTNDQTALTGGGGSNSAAVSEQMQAAIIRKEIDEIQMLQGEVDGTNNPVILSALVGKLSNSEVEVRRAALQSIKELNDTNVIPDLQKVVAGTQDPREKVAVMDVIEFLNLPSAIPDLPPDYYTNYSVSHTNAAYRIHPKQRAGQTKQPPANPVPQP